MKLKPTPLFLWHKVISSIASPTGQDTVHCKLLSNIASILPTCWSDIKSLPEKDIVKGFSVFVFLAVCRFSVFYHLVFDFHQKYKWIFGFGIPCGFWFFLFGFQFLFGLSGNYVPPLIQNSHKTSVCSTCHHSIRVLITGI